jgi:hypothetical protein
MNDRQRTAQARLRLIVAQAPTEKPPVQVEEEGMLSGLRDLPGISLRLGRHVTSWLAWHTAGVCLMDDCPPHPAAELDRVARV